MKIPDIMKERTVFSFEVFPPKTDAGKEKLTGSSGVLAKLHAMRPDYISCTYGAGGGNAAGNLDVLDAVRVLGGVIPVSHYRERVSGIFIVCPCATIHIALAVKTWHNRSISKCIENCEYDGYSWDGESRVFN
jgi:hypothetical protein